jgi:glucan 1,3-beta-glucosidase
MVAFGSCALYALQALALFVTSAPAAPVAAPADAAPVGYSSYWLASIKRQGTVAFGNSDFQIYRNVRDFGAKGDGSTDDTDAINQAISSGNRCGKGCDSSTTTPAIVYFPPGTYVVSKPIVQYYYTQLIGDAVTPPTIKAAATFQGMAVIDSDPYENDGSNWYTNQNNFFRQIRNFVIDVTGMDPTVGGTGIHWQVAQATSLQNIVFNMVKGVANSKQQGIFMDNGSGGFMGDLTFNGGNIGAFLGSQQFTTRNLTFNDCNTAIYMNWNWAWTFKSVQVNNCKVGIDMANSPANQTVGSVLVMDSKFVGTQVGFNTSFSQNSIPTAGGTLVLQNVDLSGTTTGIQSASGASMLAGGKIVANYAQGANYGSDASTAQRASGDIQPITIPAPLKDGSKVFERIKPQYEGLPASSFVSIKSLGAKGDGVTDDTTAIQNAVNACDPNKVLYFDHGAYVITKTVLVPAAKKCKIVGEIWPLIMASGEFFSDQNNPKPAFQIGNKGDVGSFEMSDMIFETLGPAPGAILMQWNMASDELGSGGLWDVHFRVGGSAGTKLQSDTCVKNPNVTHEANPACEGAFMMFHVTEQASVYVENCWFWVSDHELDLPDHSQVDIYNGRGVLIESQGPVWLYGTASEHSVLYNYQLSGAKNVFMGLIQTETPYFQGNPDATTPFKVQSAFKDPDFSTCTDPGCKKAWGLRIVDSSDIVMFGGGLYSFFDNYLQECVPGQNCQENMVSLEGSLSNVNLYGLSTKASVNMVTRDGKGVVLDKDNRSNFCGTIAAFSAS